MKFMILAWGKIEIINVRTAEQVSNILSDLTYRRTENLNGYELKVGMLEKNQSVVRVKENPVGTRNALHGNANAFKDFDEIMLNTIARYMNFKVNRVYPMDDKTFGYQLSNGTYVGAIGIIM